MDNDIDITVLLRMASMLPCDQRHRNTLINAKSEIDRLRAELERVTRERDDLWRENEYHKDAMNELNKENKLLGGGK